VTYAASLVHDDALKHIFAFDISKSYVVFEVAVYPNTTGSPVNLASDGFVLHTPQNGEPVRNTDSTTVASVIQQKNIPPPPSKVGPVVASTAVGYESGRDPYTGQRVHGTYTSTEVGVGTGDSGPRPMPSPGGYPQDRELLENQLWDKSLPAGKSSEPRAGYLYFSRASLKKKANAAYELEYLGSEQEPVLNGSARPGKVQLSVPAKTR
jgi:Tfp pilus tip-associated adhesin PilY1